MDEFRDGTSVNSFIQYEIAVRPLPRRETPEDWLMATESSLNIE